MHVGRVASYTAARHAFQCSHYSISSFSFACETGAQTARKNSVETRTFNRGRDDEQVCVFLCLHFGNITSPLGCDSVSHSICQRLRVARNALQKPPGRLAELVHFLKKQLV